MCLELKEMIKILITLNLSVETIKLLNTKTKKTTNIRIV